MIPSNKPSWLDFFGFDFSNDMPTDWKHQIDRVVRSEAIETVLDGDSPTSSEEPGTRIPVTVVEGRPIKEKLPWLSDLYANQFLEFSEQCFGRELFKCNSDNDAININCIQGDTARYEWHVDTNPVTGILFLQTLDESHGGALVFRNKGEVFRFYPKSGWFCCFSAQDVEHAVEPLVGQIERISIPMNYYDDPDNSGRDPSLNDYLTNKP